MQFKKTTLKNGVNLITVPTPGAPSVTALVIVHAGSKYETKEINGISHFLEHMCFKGTKNRPKSSDISIELDALGSQHNAFTSQESTSYYAKAHPKHLDKILDIVADLYLNPVFDPKEIEKEKGVIIEEINMYEDMPNHVVYDVFMELLYGDQPAGWPIIGPKENIKRITQNDFLDYRAKHYVASATTVIVAGNFDETNIENKVEKLFLDIHGGQKQNKTSVEEFQSKPEMKIKHKETDQTHIIAGIRTFSSKDKRRLPLKVLNAVLGGGMSSRLFQKLREEMGVAYYAYSYLDEYTDHGYIGVACGVDKHRVEEVIRAVLSELKRFATEKVFDTELQKAKEYIIGNMYLELESSNALAEYYLHQDVLSDELITPVGLAERIQKVTAEEILELAKDIMRDNRLNMAIVGNVTNEAKLKGIFHF